MASLSSRHQDKQQRILLDVFVVPQERVNGQQLCQGMAAKLKRPVNIPIFGLSCTVSSSRESLSVSDGLDWLKRFAEVSS